MSKTTAGTLVGAGVWNLAVWPAFLRRVWRDERSWSDGRPTRFLGVHAGLTGVSMALGAAVAAIGVRHLRDGHPYPPAESGPVDPQLVGTRY